MPGRDYSLPGFTQTMTTPLPTARRRALKFLAPLAVLGAVIAFIKLRPVPAETFTVNPQPFQAEVFGTGTLEARQAATISPKVTGRLATVSADQGDRVTAGQLLATLDDAEFRHQLAVAEAALGVTTATIARLRTDDTRARAILDQATLEHTRIAALATNGTVSPSDVDKAVEKLQIARAEAARARAAIAEAEAQHAAALSQIALQKELLANTRLLAPFAGLVVRRIRDPGDVVTPGGSVLELVATDELWISAWVDETASTGLAARQPARALFRSDPTATYPGHVARLGRETDRETREFLVDVAIDRLPANWTIGQRADVFIGTTTKPASLTIPARFLSYRDGTPGVYLVQGNRAHWTAIKTGLRNPTDLEITSGVQAGDELATPLKANAPLDGRRISRP